jgi:hypothetical protein
VDTTYAAPLERALRGTWAIDGSGITLDEETDPSAGTVELSRNTLTIRITNGPEFDFDDGTDEPATALMVLTRAQRVGGPRAERAAASADWRDQRPSGITRSGRRRAACASARPPVPVPPSPLPLAPSRPHLTAKQ